MILRRTSSGQALIVILMVMVVALTIGLAVASRSITDVRLTTQSEQSQRAFAAAEAGVEYALTRDLGALAKVVEVSGQPIRGSAGDVAYEVNVAKSQATDTLTSSKQVVRDDVIQILTADSAAAPPVDLSGAEITIYWVEEKFGTSTPHASLEVTEIYGGAGGGAYFAKRYGFNPPDGKAGEKSSINGFEQVTACVSNCGPSTGGKTYLYKKSITLSDDTVMVRIRPIYENASIAAQVTQPGSRSGSILNNVFPSQSYTIEGTATVGNVTRKVQVTRPLEALPPIFDFALFAGGQIQK